MSQENNLWRVFRQLVEQVEYPEAFADIGSLIISNEEERMGDENI